MKVIEELYPDQIKCEFEKCYVVFEYDYATVMVQDIHGVYNDAQYFVRDTDWGGDNQLPQDLIACKEYLMDLFDFMQNYTNVINNGKLYIGYKQGVKE